MAWSERPLDAVEGVVKWVRLDPYLLAMGGAVMMASFWPARGLGGSLLEGAVTLVIGGLFFTYGARLSLQQVWMAVLEWKPQLLVLASTYVMFPLLGWGLVHAFGGMLSKDTAQGLLFLSILPSTVQSSIAFTSIAQGNVAAAICAASLSNFIGVLLSPWLASWLVAEGGEINLPVAFRDVALQILLPFVLGQLTRSLWIGWLERHKRATSLFERGSIVLMVYSAFSKAVVDGVWRNTSVAELLIVVGIDALLLMAILGFTTLGSRLLRLRRGDEIAVIFCGSKKSMASGLPMAHVLFAPGAVGLLVVPLMLFHQLQLFLCALLARRFAKTASVDD